MLTILAPRRAGSNRGASSGPARFPRLSTSGAWVLVLLGARGERLFRTRQYGGMAEWLKAHAWKACLRETVTWVRIPLPPPRFHHGCPQAPKSPNKASATEDRVAAASPFGSALGRFAIDAGSIEAVPIPLFAPDEMQAMRRTREGAGAIDKMVGALSSLHLVSDDRKSAFKIGGCVFVNRRKPAQSRRKLCRARDLREKFNGHGPRSGHSCRGVKLSRRDCGRHAARLWRGRDCCSVGLRREFGGRGTWLWRRGYNRMT
jgi:hypothetical protein